MCCSFEIFRFGTVCGQPYWKVEEANSTDRYYDDDRPNTQFHENLKLSSSGAGNYVQTTPFTLPYTTCETRPSQTLKYSAIN